MNKILWGVLVLTVCSVLLVVAVRLSMQAYEEWKEQDLLDISRRLPGSLDYWRGIVDFKPWMEARGTPFLAFGMALTVAWATLIVNTYMRYGRKRNERT